MDKGTLRDLLAIIRGAKLSSKDRWRLNGELAVALDLAPKKWDVAAYVESGDLPSYPEEPKGWEPGSYLTSIDSAVQLVEKMGWKMHELHFGINGEGAANIAKGGTWIDEEAPDVPRAIVAALLKALSE